LRSYPQAGDVIRCEMVRCGYTTESLSERTFVSQAVLRGILTGRAKTVSTRTICALASAFGYTMSDFIDLLSK
jgi:transcriptional regulator with XRE-family HTH domain